MINLHPNSSPALQAEEVQQGWRN